MSFDSSLLSTAWSSFSTQSPTTSFSSTTHSVRRSRSRRRRSSASESDRNLAKCARTSIYHDVSPYRQSPEPKGLCGPCHGLDLEGVAGSGKRVTSALGEFVAYLDWGASFGCELCEFFKSMRVPHPHRDAKSDSNANGKAKDEAEVQDNGYHLRAFSGMLSYREYFLRPPNNQKPSSSSDTMLAVVPNGLFSDLKNPHQHYASTFGSVGYILPVAYSSRAPWLTGRPVDPHRINLPLVQTWLQHCKKKHSCTMRYSRPSNLRMIDCKTLDIVAAPPNCNYFALSYVWGAPSTISPAATQDPMVGPSAKEILRRAAPVVRDAITVVQGLGWRYLWVDKYCIPQSDAALKGEQIGKMDLIYEGAYCTIVAASGSSDRDGLPGISTARTPQPAFSHSGAHFVSSLPDPQSAVRQSTWMTRAWTFQEALCSARRLVFTPQQVYFECKGLHACEAVELPLTLLAGQHARPVLFRDEWVQGARRFGALGAFWAAVREYSGREMTFDSDALAALEGVLRRFQASPAFVYNVFGIPVPLEGERGDRRRDDDRWFEGGRDEKGRNEKAEDGRGRNEADRDKSSLLSPHLFVAGLSWHHSSAARRRSCFPSWTWAGWEGGVQLQRAFGGRGYVSDVRLWVRGRDGVAVPWEMFWDGFWRPERKQECYERFGGLLVEAGMFKVQLVQRVYQGPSTAARNKVFDMVSPYDRAVKYSSVMLPVDMVDEKKIATELWDCAVFGSKNKGGNPDVMLLRWNVDVAERVWAGTLWPQKSYGKASRATFPPLLRKRFKLG